MPITTLLRLRLSEALDACVVNNNRKFILILDKVFFITKYSNEQPSMYSITSILTKTDLRRKGVSILQVLLTLQQKYAHQLLEANKKNSYSDMTAIYIINPIYYEVQEVRRILQLLLIHQNKMSSYMRLQDELKQSRKRIKYKYTFVYLLLLPVCENNQSWVLLNKVVNE